MQVSKYFKKRFLVYVPRLIGRAQQVHREPQDALVVLPHQPLESVLVALLGRSDQGCFIAYSRTGFSPLFGVLVKRRGH